MTTKNDGGPAFPTKISGKSITGETMVTYFQGLSVRDYFAAKALGGLCAGGTAGRTFVGLARIAYLLADAMLKEREKY
jgi:hypothetical protein